MTMKKIFVSIIALAALVGCNTSMVEEVVTTLSAPMEVAVDGSSRVFDNDLKWSWQSDDTIAALQLAGDMTVNTLTLKENGKFGTDEFKYATAEAASFMFVYPAEAFDSSTFSYKFVQTGAWTPTLTGFVADATIGSFSTIEMVHQSAAFEIRVWEAGREARKSIKSATITSTADFLNGYGNTATVSGIESDTVVFNLAAGDYDFELTLTDADDTVYTVAVPTKNFVVGKRTILNVEWKAAVVEPTLSYTILSSYTNKDNSLDGRSIYVKDIVLTDADSATIALYLNGNKVADMTPGKITTVSNIALGQYSAVVKWSANGKEYTSEATTVYVTGLPYTLNPAANDSWNAWSDVTGDANIDWNVDGKLRLGYNVESPLTYGCSTQAAVKKSFYLPANTTVNVRCTGQAIGSDLFLSNNSTVFSLTVSGATVGSTESGKASTKSFDYNKSVTMTSANPTVICSNSNSVSRGRSQVSSLIIKY